MQNIDQSPQPGESSKTTSIMVTKRVCHPVMWQHSKQNIESTTEEVCIFICIKL